MTHEPLDPQEPNEDDERAALMIPLVLTGAEYEYLIGILVREPVSERTAEHQALILKLRNARERSQR